MYGCEAWTISKQVQKKNKKKTKKKLEPTEICFSGRMLQISWTAKKSNETGLREAVTRRSLINKINKRQATFLGYVMRREKLEHLVTTGMIERKRNRGSQRELFRGKYYVGWTNEVAKCRTRDSCRCDEG